MSAPALTKPCHRTRNRAFTSPATAPDNAIRAALRICRSCPTRIECATAALVAGSSVDGSRKAPAADVIQAGVICRGDRSTATALAKIAGVTAPMLREKKPKSRIPDKCRECRRPMTSWTRDEVPEGYVMHRGRGFCSSGPCRSAYRRHLEAEKATKSVQASRKDVDRRRHHPETALARLRTRARAEGWPEEEITAEEVRLRAEIAQERDRLRVERAPKLKASREEARAKTRAEAARYGWDVTTREVAELTEMPLKEIRLAGQEGLLPRTTWPGVMGYLYRLEDVVDLWPEA